MNPTFKRVNLYLEWAQSVRNNTQTPPPLQNNVWMWLWSSFALIQKKNICASSSLCSYQKMDWELFPLVDFPTFWLTRGTPVAFICRECNTALTSAPIIQNPKLCGGRKIVTQRCGAPLEYPTFISNIWNIYGSILDVAWSRLWRIQTFNSPRDRSSQKKGKKKKIMPSKHRQFVIISVHVGFKCFPLAYIA